MKTAKVPKKNETVPLEVTQQARHRILVGLNWMPRDLTRGEKATRVLRSIKDVATGDLILLRHNLGKMRDKMDSPGGREANDMAHDLDLCCYGYDKNKEFAMLIDTDAWNAIDTSGKVYHSGENMDGFSGNDDEQVYIELKDLPDNYSHFVFVVKSDCAHKFSAIGSSNVRITDSFTNQDFLRVDIAKLEGSANYAYVFAHVHKKDGKWFLKNISDFTEFEQDWPEYLKKYL